MDRSRLCSQLRSCRLLVTLFVALVALVPATGCVHQMLATMIYVWSGPAVPASYEGLEGKRVVVYCRAPSSIEYRHATAAHDLSKRVASLLEINVDKIDVASPRDVENWINESDREEFAELASALNADVVVHIDMEQFRLEKGATLYQGDADIVLTVYDMEQGAKIVWEKPLGQILYPVNSAVPKQDKSLRQFHRQFIEMLAQQIARHFYPHDPRADFAIDATAHR